MASANPLSCRFQCKRERVVTADNHIGISQSQPPHQARQGPLPIALMIKARAREGACWYALNWDKAPSQVPKRLKPGSPCSFTSRSKFSSSFYVARVKASTTTHNVHISAAPALDAAQMSEEEPDSEAKQNKAQNSGGFLKPLLRSSALLGVLANSQRLGEGRDFHLISTLSPSSQ